MPAGVDVAACCLSPLAPESLVYSRKLTRSSERLPAGIYPSKKRQLKPNRLPLQKPDSFHRFSRCGLCEACRRVNHKQGWAGWF